MASKKREGDSKREKEEENKTGHGLKKRREQGEAEQNPENAFAVTSSSFPQRLLTWEAQHPFTVQKTTLQGRGSHRSLPECLFCWETVDCFLKACIND